MWREEYEEFKCPWRDWEECLKMKCPFYEETKVNTTYDGWKKYHRCIRVLNEPKGE